MEAVEGRSGAKRTAGQQSTVRTLSRDAVSQALSRVREAAKRNRRERFTSLMQHMAPDLLACGKRPDGAFILLRQTITKRMRAKLLEIKETLYRMCHLPVPELGRWLGQVLRGYFAYHAVPTNSRQTTTFAFHVARH